MLIAMQWRTYIGLASLALTSACGFDIAGGSTPDDANGSDGSHLVDASPACPWPYTPEYAMPCPATDAAAIELIDGEAVLDTTNGTLTHGLLEIPITSEITADVRVVWTRGLHIGAGMHLRVVGSYPLVIIATGAITIDGVLDGAGHAASRTLDDSPAGANPPECEAGMAGAGVGQPCAQHGASGGGGGGYGEMGGQGGGGGDSHDCGGGNTDGMPGGTGGVSVSRPLNLRGGCPGAVGGVSTDAAAVAGAGGSGGGAIALIARDELTIDGKVNVGGSGGGGGTKRSGGGGGGSGGMIVLEASTIVITSAGLVSANGGGGGGGCDGGSGGDGEDGGDGSDDADGGPKDASGTRGGDGGARGDPPEAAAISGRGGGGGGGGVGFVRIHSAINGAQADANSISPVPSP